VNTWKFVCPPPSLLLLLAGALVGRGDGEGEIE